MKQTSVEWLTQQYRILSLAEDELMKENKYDEILKSIEQQAKEMFEEQIKEAFKHGELPPPFVNYNAEEYYNQTYKSN